MSHGQWNCIPVGPHAHDMIMRSVLNTVSSGVEMDEIALLDFLPGEYSAPVKYPFSGPSAAVRIDVAPWSPPLCHRKAES